nr:MAG TPA: hypothetical protein [Caudoviricetes sp.]
MDSLHLELSRSTLRLTRQKPEHYAPALPNFFVGIRQHILDGLQSIFLC